MNSSAQHVPLMTGVSFLMLAAMGMPMLLFYSIGLLGPDLLVELDLSRAQLGWIASASFIVAAALSPFSPWLARQPGIRAGLLVLFLLTALSLALAALLPGLPGLLLALVCAGVALALGNPLAYQTIAQAVPASRAPLVLAFKQSGVPMAALLVGVMLPALAFDWGWRIATAFWAALPLLMGVQVFSWIQPQPPGRQVLASKRLHLPNRLLLVLMAIQCCAGMALAAFIAFSGVHTQLLDARIETAGLLLASFGATGVLARLAFVRASARVEDSSLLLGTLCALAALSLALMRQADPASTELLWLGVIGMGMTLGACHPIAMNMLLLDRSFGGASVSRHWLSFGWFSGFAIGPAVFGAWLDHAEGSFRSGWLLLIAVLLAACLFAIGLMYLRKAGRQAPATTGADGNTSQPAAG